MHRADAREQIPLVLLVLEYQIPHGSDLGVEALLYGRLGQPDKEILVRVLREFEDTLLFISDDRTCLRGLSSKVLELSGGSDERSAEAPSSMATTRPGASAPATRRRESTADTMEAALSASSRRSRRAGRACLALLVSIGWTACRAPRMTEVGAPIDEASQADQRGLLTLFIENDIIVQSDDEYTSGLGASWTSPDVENLGRSNVLRKMADWAGFLPTFADPEYDRFISFTLGQEMYTPTDISVAVPPPGEQPYAGVLFLDTSVHSRGESSLHSYKLRVGLVGPSSGAEQVQKTIHRWTSSGQPKGWDTQLHDELLLNLDYQYDRRLYRSQGGGPWSHDYTANGGGGAGNYYVGANAGLQARFGYEMPDNYGAVALRSGGGALVGLRPRAGKRWTCYGYLEGQVYGVARFLPSDGNTFRDSPSVDREDFATGLTTGLVIGRGRFMLHYSLSNLGSISVFPRTRSSDYGTVAVSYYF